MKHTETPKSETLILAWIAVLGLSILPNVLFQELTGSVPAWLLAAKYALIAILLLASLVWKPASPLRRFFLAFLALFVAESLWLAITGTASWRTLMAPIAGLAGGLLASQLMRLGIALTVIVGLFLTGLRGRDLYLAPGDLDAPADPMPVVGVDKPTTWRKLGPRLCLFAFCILLAIMLFTSRPSLAIAGGLLAAVPMAMLLAALNAFSEEVMYRIALLAPIHGVLGKGQSLLLAAAFFGIGHFYGVPSGILGVAFTSLFGWILGRALLDTKGLLWPWLIHWVADVVIFTFIIGLSLP